MSSVSVNRPNRLDARRGGFERAVLWAIRGLVPPARDNQQAADFLCERTGANDRFVRWAVVRCDTLCEGDTCEYEVHDCIVDGLSRPGKTNMANAADFMCELVTSPATWGIVAGEAPGDRECGLDVTSPAHRRWPESALPADAPNLAQAAGDGRT